MAAFVNDISHYKYVLCLCCNVSLVFSNISTSEGVLENEQFPEHVLSGSVQQGGPKSSGEMCFEIYQGTADAVWENER